MKFYNFYKQRGVYPIDKLLILIVSYLKNNFSNRKIIPMFAYILKQTLITLKN
jgi:hypothetical protein